MTAGPTAPVGAPASADREGIVTPEAVLLEFATAGLGSRSLAFLLDLAIRGVLISVIFLSTAAGGTVVNETLVIVMAIGSVFAALFVYPAAFEALWNGRTPGKAVLGLRVVTVEGAPIRFRHAAIRSALGLVDFFLGAGTLAVLSALATRQSQRVGDLAAGTIVIRERQSRRETQAVAFAPPLGWEAYTARLDVSALRADAAVLVRAFLLRVHELEPGARRARAGELARLVAEAIDVPLAPETDPETFLVAVAAAHQARHGGPPASRSTERVDPSVPPPPKNAVPPPVVEPDEPPDAWGS